MDEIKPLLEKQRDTVVRVIQDMRLHSVVYGLILCLAIPGFVSAFYILSVLRSLKEYSSGEIMVGDGEEVASSFIPDSDVDQQRCIAGDISDSINGLKVALAVALLYECVLFIVVLVLMIRAPSTASKIWGGIIILSIILTLIPFGLIYSKLRKSSADLASGIQVPDLDGEMRIIPEVLTCMPFTESELKHYKNLVYMALVLIIIQLLFTFLLPVVPGIAVREAPIIPGDFV